MNRDNRDPVRGRTKLSILDTAVQERQGALMTSDQHIAGKPFSVAALVSTLNHSIHQLEQGQPHSAPLHVTAVCALLAELCGSALCHRDGDAGGIYPKLSCGDDGWRYVHEPLYYLRHAVFHPGAVLAARRSPQGQGAVAALNHVDTLRVYLLRRGAGPLARRLGEHLERNRTAVTRELAALWALETVIAMGEYELQEIRRREEVGIR